MRVAFHCAGTALVAAVEDDGPGIPAKHRARVFDPYERVADREATGDRSISSDEGTGLGLSIVRALARAHGGDVTLEDATRGNGARFVLRVGAHGAGEDVA